MLGSHYDQLEEWSRLRLQLRWELVPPRAMHLSLQPNPEQGQRETKSQRAMVPLALPALEVVSVRPSIAEQPLLPNAVPDCCLKHLGRLRQ